MKAKKIPQKIIIIKARQLGCSTLIEALIAWRTMFFSNVNAIVVSYDINHAANYLWPIMLFIYDHMPWWMQPMVSSRKMEEGLVFENPKYEERRRNPGLNSKISVKGANSSGVGQGIRLSAAHISEFADFDDGIARSIIDEDMTNALVEDENTFAILESTAKGANRYAHKLWKRCIELGAEDAEWEPLFLPFFFEATRVRPIVGPFRLEPAETQLRERVWAEWLRCDYGPCLQYHMRYRKNEDRNHQKCFTCETGTLSPYLITDEQLHWIQHRRRNAKRDDDSIKKLAQEMAASGEEAFQVTGYQIFGAQTQSYANMCVRPPLAVGDFDRMGRFHGENTGKLKEKQARGFFPCFQEDCTLSHEFDDNPMQIWEWPTVGTTYCIGADVAEGLGGKNDYSVGVVIRYESGSTSAQVATWRSNIVEPIEFSARLYHLGIMYNSGMLAVECNKYDICIGNLRFSLNYPNMYRWKHMDSVNVQSNKMGWWTNLSSRPRLWMTFRSWLGQQIFQPRSANLIEEMKNFVKEELDEIFVGADKNEHDDELIAAMIALYTAQEGNFNEALGFSVPRSALTRENCKFIMNCLSCKAEWFDNVLNDLAANPSSFVPEMDENKAVVQVGGIFCPKCHSRTVSVTRNIVKQNTTTDADYVLSELGNGWTPDQEWLEAGIPAYETF